MTKAVLEAESDQSSQRVVAAIPPPSVAVPASLHASLMARLDRLGFAKEVAQIGATIGREFSHALLARVVRQPEEQVALALGRIVQAGLLFRQGVPPQATYLFKHALVQDAAYGTLLREPRRALHSRIADTLESQFAEITESQPELLARHCTEAGQIEKAAGLWGKAGQRSLARAALLEGKEQLKRALDQIATLPATPALRRRSALEDQLSMYQLRQGVVYFLLGHRGDGADELMRKLTSERRPDLRHLARWRQAIKPRQERGVQGCWDCQWRHRTDYRVAVARLADDPTLNNRLGQFLDE
jgi:hypothetical protein